MSQVIRIKNRYEYQPDDKDCILGHGGMGIVYKGVDTSTKKPVAIKLLKSEFIARDPDMVIRFEREGRALRTLNHPNIVNVLEMVEEKGVHYLIMEYVPGGSLYDILQQEGQLSIQRILYIALDLADALTRAHRLNILHRDIKPANIMIAADGTPRLTDFGMARVEDSHITQDGAIIGTLAYLGPEIYNGGDADERTDIWAFGVVLYEMLLGVRPYLQEQPGALINAIVSQPVPDIESLRPDAPTGLIDLIYRMLNKDRHARIPSVRMVGVLLESLIHNKSNDVMQPIIVDESGRFDTPTPSPLGTTNSTRIAPNNLPAQPTAFVGRERELNEITSLIQNNERLITLIGTGGVGKSRIALAVADAHLNRFADGVYYIPLAPLEDATLLLATIAESIDFTFSNDPLGDLKNYLREKNMLLIMDNFEHMISEAGLLADLLTIAPHVTIIVTSRERLRLRGEQIYEVEGMIVPDMETVNKTTILDYPAAQLFIQSAHRVQSDFKIDNDEIALHIADIIREVYGLPLGIELASAWLDSMPVEEIAREIKQSLDFLETDLRDVPERHRSIRAIFEYSWNLMSDTDRDTFLRLSVFRGGFEREAATGIADASLRVLTSLVNKSLLRRDPNGRYSTHKLLRQYAEDRWDDVETIQTTRQKHAKYYAHWIINLYPSLQSSKEQQAVELVELEFDNVVAALHWALDCDQWDAIGQAIYPMSLYFLTRSLLLEGREIFQSIVTRMETLKMSDHQTLWIARTHVALMNSRLGYYHESFKMSEDALAYFKKGKDIVNMAYALNNMSYATMMMGQFEQARDYASRATEYMQNLEDINAWAVAMGHMGYAEYLMGNYQQADVVYETLMFMNEREKGSPTGQAYIFNNRGEITREMGKINEAKDLFQRAHDIFKAHRHRRGMAFTLNNLASVFMYQSDYTAAKKMYEESYALHRKIGDLTGIAHSISNLGNIASIEARNDDAIDCYQQALQLRRNSQDQRGIADSLSDLARIYLISGYVEKSKNYVDEAIQIRRNINDRVGLGEGLLSKAMALLMLHMVEGVPELLEEGIQIAEDLGTPMMQIQADIARGELAMLTHKDTEEAEFYFLRVLESYLLSETYGLALFGLVGMAQVRRARGDFEGALELITLVLRNPRAFVVLIEERATQMLEELTGQLPADVVTTTMERTQSMTLKAVLRGILDKAQS